MQIKDYITNDVKALQIDNKVSMARQLFKALIFTHLPVVTNGKLIGLIAESDLPLPEDDHKKISEFQYLFKSFYTFDDANWFDILKDFASNDANIIPILNKKLNYIGYFELTDILHFFNSTPFLKENGTILIISKNKNDYSLSEVAQIIERNEAKLFGAFISKSENSLIEITIKINTTNINDILQTFRRYDYTIESSIKEDEYLKDLKERSEYLQKYLSI